MPQSRPGAAIPIRFCLWTLFVDSVCGRIAVPPLQGFVMNRVGHDHMERLLYEIFVSSDENTPIDQLAQLLGQPLERVRCAISVACRLGFARKTTAPPLRPGKNLGSRDLGSAERSLGRSEGETAAAEWGKGWDTSWFDPRAGPSGSLAGTLFSGSEDEGSAAAEAMSDQDPQGRASLFRGSQQRGGSQQTGGEQVEGGGADGSGR